MTWVGEMPQQPMNPFDWSEKVCWKHGSVERALVREAFGGLQWFCPRCDATDEAVYVLIGALSQCESIESVGTIVRAIACVSGRYDVWHPEARGARVDG